MTTTDPQKCSVIFGKSLKMIPQICIMFDSPQLVGYELNDVNGHVAIDTSQHLRSPYPMSSERSDHITCLVQVGPKPHEHEIWTSWWFEFQSVWKILVKLDHVPNFRGENKKCLKPPPRWDLESLQNLAHLPANGNGTHKYYDMKRWLDIPIIIWEYDWMCRECKNWEFVGWLVGGFQLS